MQKNEQKLDVGCDYFGIEFDHHQAARDSCAYEKILLRYPEQGVVIRKSIRTYSLNKEQNQLKVR